MKNHFMAQDDLIFYFDVGAPKNSKRTSLFSLLFSKNKRGKIEQKLIEEYKVQKRTSRPTDIKHFYSNLMLFAFLNRVFAEEIYNDKSIIEIISGKKKLARGECELNPELLELFLLAKEDYHAFIFPKHKYTELAFNACFADREKDTFFKTLNPSINLLLKSKEPAPNNEDLTKLLSLGLFFESRENRYSVKIGMLKDREENYSVNKFDIEQLSQNILERHMLFFRSDSWFSLISTDSMIDENGIVNSIVNNIPDKNVFVGDNITNGKRYMVTMMVPHQVATVLVYDFLKLFYLPKKREIVNENLIERIAHLSHTYQNYHDRVHFYTQEIINPVDSFRMCIFFAIAYADKPHSYIVEKMLEHIDDIVPYVRTSSIEHIVDIALLYKEHRANMSIPICFDIAFDNTDNIDNNIEV